MISHKRTLMQRQAVSLQKLDVYEYPRARGTVEPHTRLLPVAVEGLHEILGTPVSPSAQA